MKGFKINLLLYILPIVAIPIAINWVLNRATPLYIQTIGESKDWLSFYGSYIGGIITASISFVILNKTINYNKNESEIIRQKKDMENLENRLSDHISFLNFYKIGTISLVINDDLMSKTEILKLEGFNYELIRKSNALRLIYEDNCEKHIADYIMKFDACIKQMSNDIDDMTLLIKDLPPFGIEIEKRIDIIDKINEKVKELGTHTDHLAVPVYHAAKVWLKQERDILDSLTKY